MVQRLQGVPNDSLHVRSTLRPSRFGVTLQSGWCSESQRKSTWCTNPRLGDTGKNGLRIRSFSFLIDHISRPSRPGRVAVIRRVSWEYHDSGCLFRHRRKRSIGWRTWTRRVLRLCWSTVLSWHLDGRLERLEWLSVSMTGCGWANWL